MKSKILLILIIGFVVLFAVFFMKVWRRDAEPSFTRKPRGSRPSQLAERSRLPREASQGQGDEKIVITTNIPVSKVSVKLKKVSEPETIPVKKTIETEKGIKAGVDTVHIADVDLGETKREDMPLSEETDSRMCFEKFNGLEAGVQFAYVHYDEPDVMMEYGFLYGIFAVYETDLVDKLILRLFASYVAGNLQYKTHAETDLYLSTQNFNTILDLRGECGHSFNVRNRRFVPLRG
ncbi:hypothetical protein ACFLS1_04320 [Verrucomicrobiota bacterium]